MKPSIVFKGIVRGTYSEYQSFCKDEENQAIQTFSGNSLDEVVVGLVLPEWIYILYVNGRRVVNPESYLKRKGIWSECVRV